MAIIIMINTNPFETEKFRTQLAEENKLSQLKHTYTKKFPEIKDLNSPDFWDKKNEEFQDFPMARDRTHIVYSKLKSISGRILEIGFGSGKLLKRLKGQKNLKIFGIDISPFAVSNAVRFLGGEFKKASIMKIPYKDKLFDAVVALEILEHVTPTRNPKALKEIYRVLKRKGILIVSVPINEPLEEMVLKGENPNAHVRVYTQGLIEAELKLSKFKVERRVFLYAFPNYYWLKTFIAKYVLPGIRKPNNLIILAKKR